MDSISTIVGLNHTEDNWKGKIVEDQAGITPRKSCADQIYIVQQRIEKKIKK